MGPEPVRYVLQISSVESVIDFRAASPNKNGRPSSNSVPAGPNEQVVSSNYGTQRMDKRVLAHPVFILSGNLMALRLSLIHMAAGYVSHLL